MYGLELHYTLATVTLVFMVVCTASGLVLYFKKLKKWNKPLLAVHVITGILSFAFFLLTYFLAPTIGV